MVVPVFVFPIVKLAYLSQLLFLLVISVVVQPAVVSLLTAIDSFAVDDS